MWKPRKGATADPASPSRGGKGCHPRAAEVVDHAHGPEVQDSIWVSALCDLCVSNLDAKVIQSDISDMIGHNTPCNETRYLVIAGIVISQRRWSLAHVSGKGIDCYHCGVGGASIVLPTSRRASQCPSSVRCVEFYMTC